MIAATAMQPHASTLPFQQKSRLYTETDKADFPLLFYCPCLVGAGSCARSILPGAVGRIGVMTGCVPPPAIAGEGPGSSGVAVRVSVDELSGLN